MSSVVICFKKMVRRVVGRTEFYCLLDRWWLSKRANNIPGHNASFDDFVQYECVRNRLGKVSGFEYRLEHPLAHFHNKINQRRLMEFIDAPLPKVFLGGAGEWEGSLSNGRYFIKPVEGCSAKGAYPIEKMGQDIILSGRTLNVSDFLKWYAEKHGTDKVLVEERLEDRFFDSVMDYKAFCFFGSGVDHILCMKRDGGIITSSCFSPNGELVDVGEFPEDPLCHRPPVDSIKEVTKMAKVLSRKIPLSFCRMDFYVTTRGVVLGEITPLPGLSKNFYRKKNIDMGKKWLISRREIAQKGKDLPGAVYFQDNAVLYY